MKKRIILLLDGTWNDADFGDKDTNIVRLREIIARSLWAEEADIEGRAHAQKPASDSLPDNQKSLVEDAPKIHAHRTNIVFYERGVGTGAFLDKFIGGALGSGLDRNIRRAYKFLSFYYETGDEIFIFGFSRGAFTARSLVGFIHTTGLLKRNSCTPELEEKAWNFYRQAPNDRSSGIWTNLTPDVHERDKLRISCLGVFDTVGALGVPFSKFQIFNRDKYQFHGVELCSTTDVNLHALAIDEQRRPFEPALWRKSKFKKFNTVVEQVWFPGVHSDVGGGYINETLRNPQLQGALDDAPLDWMIKRVKSHFPQFPINESGWPNLDENALISISAGAQHLSRTGVYKIMPRSLRSLNNIPVACRSAPFSFMSGLSEVNVGRDRHAEPANEMLHISALLRWRTKIFVGNSQESYAPKNLEAALVKVVSTYQSPPQDRDVSMPIVDWNGHRLDPDNEKDAEKATLYLEKAGLMAGRYIAKTI